MATNNQVNMGCTKPNKPCGCSGCASCAHPRCLFVDYSTAISDASGIRFNMSTERNSVISALSRATLAMRTYMPTAVYDELCRQLQEEECLTTCYGALYAKLLIPVSRWAEYYYVFYNRSDDFNTAAPKKIDDAKLLSPILTLYKEEAEAESVHVKSFFESPDGIACFAAAVSTLPGGNCNTPAFLQNFPGSSQFATPDEDFDFLIN